MAITRWSPFNEMSRFFDDVFEHPGIRFNSDLAVDLYQDGNDLIAEMAIAGIDPKNTEVNVEDNVLRISGHREERKETKDKDYYAREIRRGAFERAIRLPAHVASSDTRANYKSGVLKVTMPLVKVSEKRKIQVQDND